MRGSPFLRSLLAACALLLAAWPVWRLTHRQARAAAEEKTHAATDGTEVAKTNTSIHLRIEFTAVPRSFEIWHIDRVLWSAESPPPVSVEQAVKISWPPEGVDLRVKIGWPEGAPLAAARLSLIGPDGVEHQRSIWGAGPADEVLTFP